MCSKVVTDPISLGQFNHHYPVAFGDLISEVNEFIFWTGLKVLDAIVYTDHMEDFL